MYQGGMGAGISATGTGATGVAFLPDTGGFRVMFIVAAVTLSVGIITLLATGIVAIRSRRRALV